MLRSRLFIAGPIAFVFFGNFLYITLEFSGPDLYKAELNVISKCVCRFHVWRGRRGVFIAGRIALSSLISSSTSPWSFHVLTSVKFNDM